MPETARKDFENIRSNLLRTLLFHSGEFINFSNEIHKEHSLAISQEEAEGLTKLHEMICRLNSDTRNAIELLREGIKDSQKKERMKNLRRVK
jgi:hypothetical protein